MSFQLGGDLVSVVIAFLGGVLSFFSPCVLPVIPVYLSLISGLSYEEMTAAAVAAPVAPGDAPIANPAATPTADAVAPMQPARWQLFRGALAFLTGFGLVTVLVFGSLITAAGFGGSPAWITAVQWVAAAVMVVFALQMFGVFRIAALFRERRLHIAENKLGLLGALLIGAAFALGWVPCTGPILFGILSLSIGTAKIGLALAYVLGLAVPFLLAALFVNAFLGSLRAVTRHLRKIEVASGVLLLAMAVLLVSGKVDLINSLTARTGWGDVAYNLEDWVMNLFRK
ncbi:MAG TPA: cytochrome c biogenesis protein CcdA [Armatimonadota bacterium]|nr:cytochrome c biogenesis protein CcdA [Armatimonadota bacterium]